MMGNSEEYEELTNELVQAIDLAIEALKLFPPKGFNENDVNIVVESYLNEKSMALNPKPQFRNLTSLKQQVNDVFALFKEGKGEFIEYFWQKIDEKKLKFTRDHLIFKILKLKKIKNDLEFQYVNEVFFNFKERGIINIQEYNLLNDLIKNYN